MAERFAIDEVGEGVIASLRPFSWFRADNFAISAAGTTLVAAFVDKMNLTHSLAQVTAANQVSASLPDASIGNQQSAVFSGSQNYTSTYAPSAWSFLYNGSGYEAFVVMVPSVVNILGGIFQTGVPSNNSTGLSVYTFNTQLVSRVANGTTSSLSISDSGTLKVDLPFIVNTSFVSPATPGNILRVNFRNAYGTDLIGSLPTSLGTSLVLGFSSQMRWADLIIFKRVLTQYERQNVQAYIRTRYGLL
jgi:hypothetical protein